MRSGNSVCDRRIGENRLISHELLKPVYCFRDQQLTQYYLSIEYIRKEGNVRGEAKHGGLEQISERPK